jgi:hypothetical protein
MKYTDMIKEANSVLPNAVGGTIIGTGMGAGAYALARLMGGKQQKGPGIGVGNWSTYRAWDFRCGAESQQP